MTGAGHNESAVRLAALAGDAQIALDKVAKGEADATEGWLAYGAALNEGRALFAGDREFGQWIADNVLGQLAQGQVEPKEQQAAMWAAANADQLAEAKANSKARTLRGWHDQWKKIEQDREAARKKAERDAENARKREDADKARKEAEALAKAEADARAAASAAETEEERQEAEAKADEAAEAKVEAEKVAEEVEAEIVPDEPEADPEVAKVMRELAKMTAEGVAGLVTELRTALADEKVKAKAIRADRDRIKTQLADLTGDDKDTVIRRLQSELRNAENAKWRATEEQARAMKQVYALKKRVEELEGMEITL